MNERNRGNFTLEKTSKNGCNYERERKIIKDPPDSIIVFIC
jgi:hypothetical protein